MPSFNKIYFQPKRLNSTTLFYQLAIFCFLLTFLFWSTTCVAQETTVVPPTTQAIVDEQTTNAEEDLRVSNALEELLKSMNLGEFTYQVEDRPDPFMPFITEKVTQPIESMNESGERLSGMRQFEPGQLNLVAIIFTETNPMAMVEDSSHKGYVIRRGTKIGKSGEVSDILPNEVIIKQLSYSMNQEGKYSSVEMILRKEGER